MANWGALISLAVLFIAVGIGAFIAYHMYVWSNELADRANRKMEKEHIAFSKDGGLRVEVKHVKEESYRDKTQNVLVNVWNNAAFPNYRSSLGWNSTQTNPRRNPGTTTTTSSSSQSHSSHSSRDRSGRQYVAPASSKLPAPLSVAKGTGAATDGLPVPVARGAAAKRSASPVPGGWN